MAGKRMKRSWSDDEKCSICWQTTAVDVSVAVVAQRYALSANLIFKWLRDPRFASVKIADAAEDMAAAVGWIDQQIWALTPFSGSPQWADIVLD